MPGPISDTYKGPSSNYTCCRSCDVPISRDYSNYCPSCAGDVTGLSEAERVCHWVFDRITATCNSPSTDKNTILELGKFIRGQPTNITKYVPEEFLEAESR